MAKKILNSNAFYAVIAVLLSVTLWFYVTSQDGIEETRTISGIPVQFSGVERLEERSLMIVGETPKVSVRVTGLPRVIASLNNENIIATVDVSRIEGASQLALAYTITYPSEYAASVTEADRAPDSVSVTIAEYTERDIPIVGVFDGSAAEGHVAGGSEDFTFYPETLRVGGRLDLVNQIYAARVTVSGEKLTESVAGDFPYEFISNTGEVLKLDVECETDLIYTVFPISVMKEIPLTVKFTDGGGATAKDAFATFDPAFITVSGDRVDMAAIKEILLGTVDLSQVRHGDVLTFPIPLANELTNVSGITEAKVTVSLPNLMTRTYITTNIEPINVPEGWTADIITGALAVEVRGTPSALASITGDNLRVVADLSGVKAEENRFTMTAKVYLDNVGTDSGILGTDYKVVVALTEGVAEVSETSENGAEG